MLGLCHIHVIYERNISTGVITWIVAYALILGSAHFHVILVKNLSLIRATWSFICALNRGNICSHVVFVRHLMLLVVVGLCICALILGSVYLNVYSLRINSGGSIIWSCINIHSTVRSVCFHVMYVRNLLQRRASWMLTCAFIVRSAHFHMMYARIHSGCHIIWRSIYSHILGNIHLYVMCVLNFSVIREILRYIYTLILGSVHFQVIFVKKCFTSKGNVKVNLCTYTVFMWCLFTFSIVYGWHVHMLGNTCLNEVFVRNGLGSRDVCVHVYTYIVEYSLF